MKKIAIIIVVFLPLIFCLAGCAKDEISKSATVAESEFQGVADDDPRYPGSDTGENTRTEINRQDVGAKITWLNGDQISVNGVEYTASIEGDANIAAFSRTNPTSSSATPPFAAYYPSTIYNSASSAVALPATQFYNGTNTSLVLPMYAQSTDERILVFKNICGLLEFRLKGLGQVTGIQLTADKPLSGPCTIDENNCAVISSGDAGVVLDCNGKKPSINTTTETIFYVAVPPASYKSLKVTVNKLDGSKWEVTSNGGTLKVERNKIYKLAFTEVTSISFATNSVSIHKGIKTTLSPVINNGSSAMKDLQWTSSDEDIATVDNKGNVTAKTQAGTTTVTVKDNLSGRTAAMTVNVLPDNERVGTNGFSVSSSKKVCFSPGNLYFNGKAYDFEAQQYDCRTIPGKNAVINGVISNNGTPAGNWGLFGYSNGNANDYGRSTVLTTSTVKSVYDGDFVDWSKALISDKKWRSLTYDELNYMFFTRKNKVGFAKVNNVYGIIILPDSFTDPKTSTGYKYTADYKASTTKSPTFQPQNGNISIGVKNVQNIYAGAGWTAMENAGAVFIPGAGYRFKDTIYLWNENGNYWLSTTFSEWLNDTVYSKCKVRGAWSYQFNNGGQGLNKVNRAEGMCVRLVRDI